MTFEQVLRCIDPAAFATAHTIDERIAIACAAAGQRLYSDLLARLWCECLTVWSDRLSADDVRRLVRETLLLSPHAEYADRCFAHLVGDGEPAPAGGAPVVLVISCRQRKYLEPAVALRQALIARGVTAWIVVGDPDAQAARWIEDAVVVPTSDEYEALPMKVVAAIEATVMRYGPCPILKIDDDCVLEPEFDPQLLAADAARHQYTGVATGGPLHDRAWHHGKTSVPMGVYARRFHGPWANGPCYLLGARAATLIARESICFPGEFSCEYYEDKAIGDFLRRQGVELHKLRGLGQLGVGLNRNERYREPQTHGAVEPTLRSPPPPSPVFSPSLAAASSVSD